MKTEGTIVRPASGRTESWIVAGVVAAIFVASGLGIAGRSGEETEPRLFDWQVSAFYDLDPTDQGIYNAMAVAGEELWWYHDSILAFGTEEEKADPWPTVEQLDVEYLMPPFVRDAAWVQQGEVQWERVASYSFEGFTAYFGSNGGNPGQSAYLLVLNHAHKGASYRNGATIWFHPDPTVEAPATVVRDSLIVNGWKEIVPYSGRMEVERLKGG